MKRIIISIIIAIAVVCGSIFEIAFVSSKSDEYIGRIKKIDDLVRDDKTEAAIAECRRLESDWDKNVGSIDVMLIHDYADSVGAGISKMRSHLENGSLAMYFCESADAEKGLASIKGSEYPLIENIL